MPDSTSIRHLVRLQCRHADCLSYLDTMYVWGRLETGKIFMDDDGDLLCSGCGREMEIQP